MDEAQAEDPKKALRASRRKLLLIIGIVALPFLIARLAFFYFPQWIPQGRTNQGILITPPVSIADLPGAGIEPGKWTLIQMTGTDCDTRCRQVMYLARQVHIGLGKDAVRVRRVLLVAGEMLDENFRTLIEREHPDMSLHFVTEDRLRNTFAMVDDPVRGGYVFLMDPMGNIMMFYPPALGGKPMQKDLKHLLRVSRIG